MDLFIYFAFIILDLLSQISLLNIYTFENKRKFVHNLSYGALKVLSNCAPLVLFYITSLRPCIGFFGNRWGGLRTGNKPQAKVLTTVPIAAWHQEVVSFTVSLGSQTTSQSIEALPLHAGLCRGGPNTSLATRGTIMENDFKLICWVWNFCHCLHYRCRKTWVRIPAQSKASFFPQKDFQIL